MARWPLIVPFRSRTTRTPAGDPPGLIEGLEPRVLLYDAPMLANMPSLSDLERRDHSVVRFQTNFGIVDIELFDDVAPVTVQNFINYVNKGAYDEMFFHRTTQLSTSGIAVVQGGGFKFRDGTGKFDVDTDDPIVNEFQRPNTARTIAMAKLGGQPNSATSQFFFNVTDNPALNSPLNSGGFTVFGRVIRGWWVIEAIQALAVRDLDQAFTGFNPPFGVFEEVPVSSTFNPAVGPQESTLVYLWDAEVIKPRDLEEFYDEAVYFPEGFRTDAITERIDLVNSMAADNFYQIIVRYESGERDQVIASGFVEGRGRRTVNVANAITGAGIVRSDVGYAIEVRSTAPLAASLNHRDFGVVLAESFVRAEDLENTTLKKWTFAHGEKGGPFRSFLVWQNLTQHDANVTVTFYHNTQPPKSFNFVLPRYGRGGVNVDGTAFAIPNGRYSVRISSTRPIIAALSLYETSGSGPTQVTNGFNATGVPGGGRSEGYLAAAKIANNGTSLLSFLYTQTSPAQATVDVHFYLTNGTMITAPNPVVLNSTTRRVDRNLASFGVNLPVNQLFSIGYRVRETGGSVSVQYVSESNGDTMSTPFTVVSNGTMHFADGLIDTPGTFNGYSEILSLFSPYTNPNIEVGFRVRFRFSDGTEIVPIQAVGTLAPRSRIDIVPQQLSAVMAKVNSGPQFRIYSMIVETGFTWNGTPFFGAIVGHLTRTHAQTQGQTMITGPTLDEAHPLVWMSNGQYD